MNNAITKEQILEEAKIYRSLSNDITDSWNKVLKWRHISKARLSRITGISEKTIGYIINGQKSGSIDNVVLMCLGANLPGEISEHLLRLSGYTFLFHNEDQIIYHHLIWYKHNESLPEIHNYLQEIGSDNYLFFPAITENMEL